MKKILLRSPGGERWVESGRAFRFLPGEEIALDTNGKSIVMASLEDSLSDIITPEGILVGNLIKKVTTTLGIKQCLRCKGRQRRYNKKGLELQQKVRNWFN